MEYNRPKRYVTYNSKKCKTYLAKDFNHECAYCKFKELIPINRNGWEIDHFKPVSKFSSWDGLNKYDNLFYSCQTCNNSKGDEWSESLLNPCKDDIYGVHIREDKKTHEMIAITEQGKEYIETFKINATQSVQRRKKLAKLKELKELEKVMEENKEKIQQICEETEETTYIKMFQKLLSKYNIHSTYGMYEYDLDLKLNYNNKEIFCDLNFETDIKFRNHKKQKRILGEKIKDWLELDKKVCYVLMDITSNEFFFLEIKKDKKKINRYKVIHIDENNNIEENIEKYKKTFFE